MSRVDAQPIPMRALSLLILGEGWFPQAPGGLPRFVRQLHEGLQNLLNVRTLVLGPSEGGVEGVRFVSDKSASLVERVLAYSAVTRKMAREADVAEVHFALYALLPLLAGALRSVPIVAHFHGPWAAESEAMGDQSLLRVGLKKAVESYVYRRANRAIVHSQAFKRILVERYGVSPWNIDVLAPGVDLQRFSPGDRDAARQRLGLGKATKVVVSVRRLVPRTGVDILLDACSRVRDGGRDDLVLVIGGDGPERAALEARAVELGIASHTRFLGRIDDEELVDIYRIADLCVVPSTALEGFGLVVLEALACPAVSSRSSVFSAGSRAAWRRTSFLPRKGHCFRSWSASASRPRCFRLHRPPGTRAESRSICAASPFVKGPVPPSTSSALRGVSAGCDPISCMPTR